MRMEIMKRVKHRGNKRRSRSVTIERLVREGLAARPRRAADAKDLTLINKHADKLNAEAKDVLRYLR